jgi:predicted ATP-dependent serine protease
MERLDADLDRLHHGGEALVFRGEPGIGKSALLKHASWRAAESGFRTLATVGVKSEAKLAFAVRCCTTVHVYDAVVMGAGQAGLSAS